MDVQQSEELADWIDSKIRNLEILDGIRARFSASCFEMVHEHHRSIAILIAHCLYGSALALARPTYEAFVRGVWIWECATEKQIQKLLNADKIDSSFKSLVSDIEKKGQKFGTSIKQDKGKTLELAQ